MSNRDEEERGLSVEEFSAVEGLPAYEALEKISEESSQSGGASSSQRSSGMDQLVYYYREEEDRNVSFSVRELTSHFDEEIKKARAENDGKKLQELSSELIKMNQHVQEDDQNIKELKALVAQYEENRSSLITKAMAAQAERKERRAQQSPERTPVIPSPSSSPPPSPFFASASSASPSPVLIPFSSSKEPGFTVLGDGAQRVFDDLFETVKKGRSSEERGEVFSKKLGLPLELQWRVDIDSKNADELIVSGKGPQQCHP